MNWSRWGPGLAGAGLIGLAAGLATPPRCLERLDPSSLGSFRLEDRRGRLLREVSVPGARARWVPLDELPPWVPASLEAAEDGRFRRHPGVDPLAMLRAARDNVARGRITSGGSTITQQLVRLLKPSPRTWRVRALEAVEALKLELRLSKAEILEQYLNRLSFGRGAVGIEAASMAYFNHPARTLSPGEAAWLAVLPRSPARYAAAGAEKAREDRRRKILGRLFRNGMIDATSFRRALEMPSPAAGHPAPFEAPHFTGWLLDRLPPDLRSSAARVRTTLDGGLQEAIEDLVRIRSATVVTGDTLQAAAVVLDNVTGEILALVGSADFFDSPDGQVNGALALRQPGSALKPFTCALAFEQGWRPWTPVTDEENTYPAPEGSFTPRNYGGTPFGRVRMREALGSSMNMAAVDLLDRIGPDRLQARLQIAGLMSLDRDPETYGLGLTLGVGEVRLLDLAAAYRALAQGGWYREPAAVLAAFDARGRRLPGLSASPARSVFDSLASWWVMDILSDDAARYRAFGRGGVLDMPWPVAAKTGTSSDWRDNWAVGCTREFTAGVWVGRFSGKPMWGVSGIAGAAPLLRNIFALLSRDHVLTAPPRPVGLMRIEVCSETGGLAGECPGRVPEYAPVHEVIPACGTHGPASPDAETPPRFTEATLVKDGSPHENETCQSCLTRFEPSPSASAKSSPTILKIRRPATGDVYFLDPALPVELQAIIMEAHDFDGVTTWRVDGRILGQTAGPHRLAWPLQRGRHRLELQSGREKAQVEFTVAG